MGAHQEGCDLDGRRRVWAEKSGTPVADAIGPEGAGASGTISAKGFRLVKNLVNSTATARAQRARSLLERLDKDERPGQAQRRRELEGILEEAEDALKKTRRRPAGGGGSVSPPAPASIPEVKVEEAPGPGRSRAGSRSPRRRGASGSS